MQALVFHAMNPVDTLGEHCALLWPDAPGESVCAERRRCLAWQVFADLMRAALRPLAQGCRPQEGCWRGWRLAISPLPAKLDQSEVATVIADLREVLAAPDPARREVGQREIDHLAGHQQRMEDAAGKQRGEPIRPRRDGIDLPPSPGRFKPPGQFWTQSGDEFQCARRRCGAMAVGLASSLTPAISTLLKTEMRPGIGPTANKNFPDRYSHAPPPNLPLLASSPAPAARSRRHDFAL